MRLKFLTSALISASMIGAVPAAAVAQTSSAAKLSVARAGAPAGESRLMGEGAGGIIALALLAGIVAIVVVGALADDDNATSP